jgi:hypothetical protein
MGQRLKSAASGAMVEVLLCNLGTLSSRAAAEKHERAVQFFKRR